MGLADAPRWIRVSRDPRQFGHSSAAVRPQFGPRRAGPDPTMRRNELLRAAGLA